MKKTVLFFCIAISVSAMAQKKEFINPKPVGYSDATVVRGGRTIYISGQVPLNA